MLTSPVSTSTASSRDACHSLMVAVMETPTDSEVWRNARLLALWIHRMVSHAHKLNAADEIIL